MKINEFDWDALKKFISERKPVSVYAGLLDDWFFTADTVYRNGIMLEDHGAYLHSYWATPGFKALMENGDVIEVVASKDGELKR